MTIQKQSILRPKKYVLYKHFLTRELKEEIQGLTLRLFIQVRRRPSHVLSGLVQPILWLVLFGALFQNIPLNLSHLNYKYTSFLSCGILIFTCFTGSLNTGLPLIFDREFGFLNRLLVSPLRSRNTILVASVVFITCITMIQSLIIFTFSLTYFSSQISFYKILLISLICILLTIIISSFSLGLAFILPGHIEFLACILLINLPTLFTSTALAPMYLMPYWLQILSTLNILTYAIEALRLIIIEGYSYAFIIKIFSIQLNLLNVFFLLLIIGLVSITTVATIINNKLE